MEYICFLSVYSPLAIINIFKPLAKEERVIFICFVLLTAFLIGARGFEDEYSILFDRVPPLDIFLFEEAGEVAKEKGYLFALIASVIKSLGGDSLFFLIFFAVASLLIQTHFFRIFTPYYALAFLIYLSHAVIFKDLVTIRAGLASALILPMIYFHVNRKRFFFFITLFAAFQIHYVSILALVLLFANRQYKTSHLVYILLGSIIFIKSGAMYALSNILANIGPGIVKLYLSSDRYGYNLGLTHPKILQQILITSGFLILMSIHRDKNSKYDTMIFNTYFISTIFFIIFSGVAILSTRIAGLFYVVEPILLVSAVRFFKQRKTYLFSLVVASFSIAMLNYYIRGKVPEYIFREF